MQRRVGRPGSRSLTRGRGWPATHERLVAALGACVLVVALVPAAHAADPSATPSAPPAVDPGPPADPGVEPEAGVTGDPLLDVFGTAGYGTVGTSALEEGLSPDCLQSADAVAAADALLADQYTLGSWPAATLPHDLTWSEDPYADANWRFNFHSLRYVINLVEAGIQTTVPAYADRALELAADWIADNPRDGAVADMAWNDHSTALRAVVFACIADRLAAPDWLLASLVVHGETLADPAFYVNRGNHALNQAIGLLEVGRVLARKDWVDLAVQRITTLVDKSIDAQGVTNEQAIAYQLYNYRRYSVAKGRLLALGLTPAATFDRVELMPELLAYATLPSGYYELLGDTSDLQAASIPGTWAEFTATAGASGPRPPSRIRRFTAGFLFARSGWGTSRAFQDETALSIRYGPKQTIHGHEDGASLTLAAWGSRLLVDPGMYAYQGGAFRAYMLGRSAHNVVTVSGATWRSTPTTLIGSATTARYLDVRLRATGYAGVVHDRRITWSRRLDYLVVEDRLRSSTTHTYRQLWHLPPGTRLIAGTRAARTVRPRGNVLIRQLTGDFSQRVVTGQRSPIQGWTSFQYSTLEPAPVLEVAQRARNVRYVTLLVPAAGRPSPEVLAFTRTSGGYRLRIRIGGRTERIEVSGSSVTVTDG